jgi:predicted phage-related endonuclease
MGSKPKRISASRVSALFGLNEYLTPIDLWMILCSEEYPEFEYRELVESKNAEISEKAAVKLGLEFEKYIHKYVNFPGEKEKYFESPNGLNTAHLDNFVILTNSNLNVELKTTSICSWRKRWSTPDINKIPREYRCQVQQQMGLSESKNTDIWCLVFPKTQEELLSLIDLQDDEKFNIVSSLSMLGFLHKYTVEFNQEIWNIIQEKSVIFWDKYIKTVTPPPAQGFSDMKKIMKPVNGECIATPEITTKINLYNKINKEFDRVEKNKDLLKSQILEYMKNNCTEAETNGMILLDNRGIKLAGFNKKLTVRKEKDFD